VQSQRPWLSSPRQRVSDADCGDNGPFDRTDSAGNTEACQEGHAPVLHVADYRQVHAGACVLMLVVVMRTIVCRPVGR